MASTFHPLPVQLFDNDLQPSIKRLNSELREIFALEGVIRNPRQIRRSDLSVVRRAEVQVHVSRVSDQVAGATVTDAATLDGLDSTQFLRSDATDSYTSGTLTFNSGTTVNIADGSTFNFNRVTGTSPFTVDSTTVVANLNADTVDGIEGANFLRSDEDDTGTGTYRLNNAIPLSLTGGSSRTIAYGQTGVSETLNITGDGTVANTLNIDGQFTFSTIPAATSANLSCSASTTFSLIASAGDLSLTSTSDDILLTSGNDITLTAGSGNIQANDIVTLTEGAFLADADIIRFGNTVSAYDVSLSWETEGTDALQLKPRTDVDVNLKIGTTSMTGSNDPGMIFAHATSTGVFFWDGSADQFDVVDDWRFGFNSHISLGGAQPLSTVFLNGSQNSGTANLTLVSLTATYTDTTTSRQVIGVQCQAVINSTSGRGSIIGGVFKCRVQADGPYTVTSNTGIGGRFIVEALSSTDAATVNETQAGLFRIDLSAGDTSTWTTNYSMKSEVLCGGTTGNELTTHYHCHLGTPTLTGAGTITNLYGVYIEDQTGESRTITKAIHIEPQDGTGQGATVGNIDMDGGDWNTGHLQLGAAHIWFDGTDLRGNVAAPTSGSDGTFLLGPYSLTADVTGILPVANGGTALASGTDGGILGYTATGTLASSALLAANQVVLGGGAGGTPTTLAAGTAFQHLRMNSGATAAEWAADTKSKSITIEDPASADLIGMWMNEAAITVLGISFSSAGGTDVTFDVEFNTTLATGGTVIHNDVCATSTPEWDVTPSGTAAVPTDRIIVVDVTAVTGSVTDLVITVHYRENA